MGTGSRERDEVSRSARRPGCLSGGGSRRGAAIDWHGGKFGHLAGGVAPVVEEYRVVAPNLFGHGESAKPRGDYSLGAFAVWLRDLLDELGISRATVVGQSLGGGVAIHISIATTATGWFSSAVVAWAPT